MATLALRPMTSPDASAQAGGWPTIAPDKVDPTAVFLGGSSAAGSGAGTAKTRWTTLLATAKGWTEANFAGQGNDSLFGTSDTSCGGKGCLKYQDLVAKTVALDPSFVVVAVGQSENATDPAVIAATISASFTALRVGLPNATLIAVGPAATASHVTERIQAVDAATRTAATSAGATYISLLEPNVFDDSMVGADGITPNDAGHAAIATRIEAAFS
ncbi:hypothetical protein GCM10022381_31300 [Leifsonia kafniensis]|uniref:SGNH hydrolase-type esterase domain-containing protein n=2 Tax=Leifsonia kafniensis TaxID=475957 RepID=A0ABP7KSV1_9MICO